MYLHTSQKCWERRSDDLDNKQDVREAIAIKWMNQSKWPTTYYSSHYCIDAMKQYNCVFKVYAYCHHCSTVHEVPHRLDSTMLCCPTLHSPILFIIVLFIIILQQSTTRAPSITVLMICMTMMMLVQLAMMLTMTAIICIIPVTAMSHPPFSMVLVPMEIQRSSSMDWMDASSTTIHPRTRLGSYLIIQMTSLSLLNSRYHHLASWTWVHMSLSSCCS